MPYREKLEQRLASLRESSRLLEARGETHSTIDGLIAAGERELASSVVYVVGQHVRYDNPGHGYHGRTGIVRSIILMGGGVWDWAEVLDDNHHDLPERISHRGLIDSPTKMFGAPFWDLRLVD